MFLAELDELLLEKILRKTRVQEIKIVVNISPINAVIPGL